MRKVALAIPVVLALSACTINVPGSDPGASKEARYVKEIKREIPQLDSLSRGFLIEQANTVCTSLRSEPVTREGVVAFAMGFSEGANGMMSNEDVVTYILTSTETFCPDVHQEIKEVFSTTPGVTT